MMRGFKKEGSACIDGMDGWMDGSMANKFHWLGTSVVIHGFRVLLLLAWTVFMYLFLSLVFCFC